MTRHDQIMRLVHTLDDLGIQKLLQSILDIQAEREGVTEDTETGT